MANVTVEQLIVDLLRSLAPEWKLRGFVRTLLAQGFGRETLRDDLLRLQSHLQETGQEREEDFLLGIMDSSTGWCAPGSRL